MNRHETTIASVGQSVFEAWLHGFGAAVEARAAAELAAMFDADGHWKDLLALTWEHRTFSGRSQIEAALGATLGAAEPSNVRLAAQRTRPRLLRRSGRNVLEGFFDFDTKVGSGSGFVRLLYDEQDAAPPRIWLLLTTLQSLDGREERVGKSRPTGSEFAMNELGRSWRVERDARRTFTDSDPEVIVIGAGQAGLTIAARLSQMGVSTLVIERSPRIGDVWRSRYDSLTLHNEVTANHLPYLPFPETWPLWLAKDQLAGWLEAYAEFLELNVWTGTAVTDAVYDDAGKRWTARLQLPDGGIRTIQSSHIVIATGVSGSVPHIPALPGAASFKGDIIHSSVFKSGTGHQGKRAVVVGTGNSGHDIAQDLVVKGAERVWIMQRGPTCVASLEPTAAMVYKIYGEGLPTDDVDLMNAAIPYPVLEQSYRWITQKGAELDKDLLAGLNRAGFKTYFGRDGTGFQMMFMRGEGGYYIDVGCSRLIADGSVGVIQADDVVELVEDGLRMRDGTVVACDAVVLATGFKNMQENVRLILGDDVADRIGPVWGFDEHFQMRNMWRRTAQPGLWISGGSLLDSRLYSRFLAIEIRAALDGLLPEKADLPLRAH